MNVTVPESKTRAPFSTFLDIQITWGAKERGQVMRIIEKRRGYFYGTHMGATIEIERDYDYEEHKFYIRVRWKDGGYMYDGYSPEGITTIAQAKREAIRAACLDGSRS